jgi:hypothetical protein
MGYHDNARNRWVATSDVTLRASATEVANGSSPAVGVDRGTVRLLLDVTAKGADADETLDVTVETSFDGAAWRSLGAFARKTAVGAERKSFPGADRFVRITWAVGGTTPSFTFSVTGEAI